jgi:hypothetical protein
VLKTNDALLQQRIQALESGAKSEVVVVKQAPSDPARAKALAAEIEVQRAELADAKAESEKYGGGLVKALAETAVATASSTLALLEQERLKAEFGLVLPALASPPTSTSPVAPSARPLAAASPPTQSAADCLKIETFDSSILGSNSAFTEVAWKVDVST